MWSKIMPGVQKGSLYSESVVNQLNRLNPDPRHSLPALRPTGLLLVSKPVTIRHLGLCVQVFLVVEATGASIADRMLLGSASGNRFIGSWFCYLGYSFVK